MYSLAQVVGIEYAVDCSYVDLFINGEYWGNYLLSEKIEVDKSRIDITDLEELNEKSNGGRDLQSFQQAGVFEPGAESMYGSKKWIDLPSEPEDVTGGYLMEFQPHYRYEKGVSGFVSEYGQVVVLNSPQHAGEKQIDYISSYYNEFEQALLSRNGYNNNGKHYSDYIDVQSFAKQYIIQEFIQNYDAGLTSIFLYKDTGGKICAGPVWDFDYSGIREGSTSFKDTQRVIAANRRLAVADTSQYKLTIFGLLWKHQDFRNTCRAVWKECFEPNINELAEYTDYLYNTINRSAVADRTRWNRTAVNCSNSKVARDYETYVKDYIYYIENRINFMKNYLTE